MVPTESIAQTGEKVQPDILDDDPFRCEFVKDGLRCENDSVPDSDFCGLHQSRPENPPAFPQVIAVDPHGNVYRSNDNAKYQGDETAGLSIRDYFAAAALQGMFASSLYTTGDSSLMDGHVARCFEYADAMLAAREARS